MSSIVQFHQELYEYLIDYRRKIDPNFRFTLRKSNRAGLLDKGYWFAGDEDTYLVLSFWTGTCWMQRMPNIALVMEFEKGKPTHLDLRIYVDINEPKKEVFAHDDLKENVKQATINELGRQTSLSDVLPNMIEGGFTEEKWGWNLRLVTFRNNFKSDFLEFAKSINEEKLKNNEIKYILRFVLVYKAAIDNLLKTEKNKIVIDPQFNINQIRPLEEEEFIRMVRRVESYRKKDLQSAPIRLLQLQVKHYRGIDDLDISFRENAPWIFLTGENGYGKTVILQALALALGQYRKETYSIQIEEKPELIEAKIRSKTRESVVCKPLREQGRPPEFNFVAYGSSRQQMNRNGDNDKTDSPYYGLFEADAVFRNLEAKLQSWAFQKDDKKNPFFDKLTQFIEEVLGYLLPTEFDIESDYDEGGNTQQGVPIRIDRNDDRSRIYYTVAYQNDKAVEKTFEQLSAGYRNIIGFVGDMLVRFYENAKGDADVDPAELTGIVLIDEIELHLHPKWQRELVKRMSEVFPKVQFVVSTHSPIPLLGAPANAQIFHVTRTNEAGIQMEDISDRMNIKHYNLTPDTLLSSPIFGFNDLIPVANQQLADLRTENSYQEAVETEALKQRVEAGAEIRAAAYQKWMNP